MTFNPDAPSLYGLPGESRDPPFHRSQAEQWVPAFAGTRG
jgi:hypothetical protein